MVDGVMTFDDVVKKMQRSAKGAPVKPAGASRLAAAERALQILS